jgi:hypothetical protein
MIVVDFNPILAYTGKYKQRATLSRGLAQLNITSHKYNNSRYFARFRPMYDAVID